MVSTPILFSESREHEYDRGQSEKHRVSTPILFSESREVTGTFACYKKHSEVSTPILFSESREASSLETDLKLAKKFQHLFSSARVESIVGILAAAALPSLVSTPILFSESREDDERIIR